MNSIFQSLVIVICPFKSFFILNHPQYPLQAIGLDITEEEITFLFDFLNSVYACVCVCALTMMYDCISEHTCVWIVSYGFLWKFSGE